MTLSLATLGEKRGRFYYLVFRDAVRRGFRVVDEHPLQWLKKQSYYTVLLFFTEIPEEEFMRWNDDNKN